MCVMLMIAGGQGTGSDVECCVGPVGKDQSDDATRGDGVKSYREQGRQHTQPYCKRCAATFRKRHNRGQYFLSGNTACRLRKVLYPALRCLYDIKCFTTIFDEKF